MLFGNHPGTARIRLEPLATGPMVESALVTFWRRPGPFILESSAAGRTYGRYTVLGCDPVHTVSIGPDDARPLITLADHVGRFPAAARVGGLPFCGGWVGYVSYEAGLTVEGLRPAKAADMAMPLVRFALYDTVAVYDRTEGRWYASAVDWPADGPLDRPPAADRLAALGSLLNSEPTPKRVWHRLPAGADTGRMPVPQAALDGPICSPPVPDISRNEYLRAVERAKRYIEAGDVYQVNLTQRFRTTTPASPLEVYLRLRGANPSNFAALLQWGDQAVISSSPELFLDLRDGRVVTRPIKGTRPRLGDPVLDPLRRRELLDSPKDRAELTMIVDLLRNDLGRVCRFGSVRVRCPAESEDHPTVYHLVATIEGRLRPECGWIDLLQAASPGGSITGAPKIRAMQIIDELEPTWRGVYCGSIGYIGLDGSMGLNVAIRTMIQDGPALYLFAGGGIVADSDPADEYDETLAKAAGMMRALGHDAFTVCARSIVGTC